MRRIFIFLTCFVASAFTQNCLLQCPTYANPVCGVYDGDYRVFASRCRMLNRNCNADETWTTASMTLCEQNSCPMQCTADTAVCGTNGNVYRRFDNLCRLMAFACNNNQRDWRQVDMSNCRRVVRLIRIRPQNRVVRVRLV